MDFNTVYAQKLTTADRVAALVKDDDWVDYGWAIGTPVSFDAALAKRLPERRHPVPCAGNFQDRKSGRALLLEQLAYGRH